MGALVDLASGSRIGPYEVGAALGAGGMGVVYRARDTRLGRDVALKVLPETVRSSPERLRRFEQEARTTGALNHPNVLAVYDVGTHEGAPYLVTELLEGATLRARLRDGPVPPRRALDWAGQVARGLAAAHEKGLVHRDLKPENLFVTRDGRVKILDFGLAKASVADDDKDSDTLAETEPGAVMGTAGYMAPEQVRGRPADARADIFAFGAILYEVLCGRRAFDGETSVERGYAILNSEPPGFAATDGSQCHVPPAVERIVRRCLEKEPEERFQSARDLAFALEAVGDVSGSGERVAVTEAASRRRRVERIAAAVVVLAAIGAAFAVGSWTRARRAPPATAAAPPAEPARYVRITYRVGPVSSARFTDDGRSVVYTASVAGAPPMVYQATPGRREARPITPKWTKLVAISRSGEMALVLTPERQIPGKHGTLARASLAGGSPREVMENVPVADFGPRDDLLVVRHVGDRARLEYPAGKLLLEVGGWVSRARVSPDGSRVAFLHHPLEGDDRGTVEVADLQGARRTLAGPFWTLTGLAWTPDGREVWFGAARREEPAFVHAVTPDGRERVVTRGPGRLCVEDIARDGRVLLIRADFGHRLAAFVPGADREIDLTWYDSTMVIDLSRDGSQILFAEGGEASVAEVQTFLRRTDGSSAVHLSEGWGRALSPDGHWALVSPKAPFDTLALVPTGPGESRPVPVGPLTSLKAAAFTPDGKRLVLLGRVAGRPLRLWTLELPGGAPTPIGEEGMVHATRPSPDGKLVAAWTKDGRSFLVPLDGGAAQPLSRISPGDKPIGWTDGGRAVLVRRAWRRDQRGAEILAHELATGKERPWRTITPSDTTGLAHPANVHDILVTPDGRYYVYGYAPMDARLFVAEGLR
jgi:hypothetical protein